MQKERTAKRETELRPLCYMVLLTKSKENKAKTKTAQSKENRQRPQTIIMCGICIGPNTEQPV